jgi:hypothetical protein
MKTFNKIRSLILLAVVLAGTTGPVRAQDTNAASSRPDFTTFKLVTERNIFNARRRGRTIPGERTTRRSVRADYAALAGTMSYDKGNFAFFDGSSSEFSKSVKVSDTIAGFTVTDIQRSAIKLESGTNKLELQVGMQLRREQGGDWQITERTDPTTRSGSDRGRRNFGRPNGAMEIADAAVSGDDTNAPPDEVDATADPGPDAPATAPATPTTTDPVLLRLMQRRAAEGNR